MFFPSHEHIVALLQGLVVEIVRVEVLLVVHESSKLSLQNRILYQIIRRSVQKLVLTLKTHEMLPVDFLVGVPFAGEEGILLRDNLPVEESRERGELEGQSGYFEVPAKVRIGLVHMLRKRNHKITS